MLEKDEWMVVVNYYGQIDNTAIGDICRQYRRVIVDNTQAYYQMPLPGVDTIYSCRKFFGVPDGAFLYTDVHLQHDLPQDESGERVRHLVGRYEKSASEFYSDYLANEKRFENIPLRRMSKLTENMLRGIDYTRAKQKRTDNFRYLNAKLGERNKLQLTVPDGPFMYPLWIDNGAALRKELQRQKIYIPTLWPNVLEDCAPDTPEYELAANILPLPVDQRYGEEEMTYLTKQIIGRADTK